MTFLIEFWIKSVWIPCILPDKPVSSITQKWQHFLMPYQMPLDCNIHKQSKDEHWKFEIVVKHISKIVSEMIFQILRKKLVQVIPLVFIFTLKINYIFVRTLKKLLARRSDQYFGCFMRTFKFLKKFFVLAKTKEDIVIK